MVDVSVDNDPVSVQLENNETFTVPAGETMKVSFLTAVNIGGTVASFSVRINGVDVDGAVSNNDQNAGVAYGSHQGEDIVLTAGDTVSVIPHNGDGGLHISGFVVSK
jgi:hypothetical protein